MTTPSPPKTTSTTNKPTVSTPKTYTDHALILRTQNLGEADRIIIMLTRNNGITHAVAKSIRKPNSKFGARLEPYMHVALSLTQGRGTLRTITQTYLPKYLSACATKTTGPTQKEKDNHT